MKTSSGNMPEKADMDWSMQISNSSRKVVKATSSNGFSNFFLVKLGLGARGRWKFKVQVR